jgi:FAD dependent oxidoreductase
MIGVSGRDVARVRGDRGDRGPRTAIVVGAGVVGLSAAWFSQQRGVEVTVLDHNGVAAGASRGNAGWIAPGLTALHEPAVLRYGVRSLMRPTGSRRDLATPDPGWWGFLAQVSANRRWSSWTRAVRRNGALNDECLDAVEMLTAHGVDARTVKTPVIATFRTMRLAESLLGVLDRLEEVGQPVERSGLFGQALRDEMPLASPELTVGVRIEGRRYTEPEDLTHALVPAVAGYATTSCTAKHVAITANDAAGHRRRPAIGTVIPSVSRTVNTTTSTGSAIRLVNQRTGRFDFRTTWANSAKRSGGNRVEFLLCTAHAALAGGQGGSTVQADAVGAPVELGTAQADEFEQTSGMVGVGVDGRGEADQAW